MPAGEHSSTSPLVVPTCPVPPLGPIRIPSTRATAAELPHEVPRLGKMGKMENWQRNWGERGGNGGKWRGMGGNRRKWGGWGGGMRGNGGKIGGKWGGMGENGGKGGNCKKLPHMHSGNCRKNV